VKRPWRFFCFFTQTNFERTRTLLPVLFAKACCKMSGRVIPMDQDPENEPM
jgi:hypothetical protein